MRDNQRAFFEIVLGTATGYLSVGFKHKDGGFKEQFFRYPESLNEALDSIEAATEEWNVYFCPVLFNFHRRNKNTAAFANSAWADLDECPPENMKLTPTIVMETSHHRYQALWVLDGPVPPSDAEEISHKIAVYHKEQGADQSGWDMTQLLRVPWTNNFKYDEPWQVSLMSEAVVYEPDKFSVYPPISTLDLPLPSADIKGEDIIEEHRVRLPNHIVELFYNAPAKDWSTRLWHFELSLYDAGLTPEEVFFVVRDSACNKYARDSRSDKDLWKEVLKASTEKPKPVTEDPEPDPLSTPVLLTADERQWALTSPSIITQYCQWAEAVVDAPKEYHEIGSLAILSALLAGNLKVGASFGYLPTNLWFMLMADTTLTRKTTSMDLAMDLLVEIDDEAVLATDGSIEGIMSSLASRPGKPSVFLRDEFSGLLEAFSKRDYYSGMAETMTKLYDGKMQKRVLRRETIEVRQPVFIMFTGGIKRRILDLLTYEYVYSGFLPRFIIVTATADRKKLRPLGPPTEQGYGLRHELSARLRKMYDHYHQSQVIMVGGKEILTARTWDAQLTEQAWERYNRYEQAALDAAASSFDPDLTTPTFARLCISGLKTAVLLAAAERLEDEVRVEESDVVRAFAYVEKWMGHSLEVLTNMGRSELEKTIVAVYKAIKAQPGVSRSKLMRQFHMTARQAVEIFDTLNQRGLIGSKGKDGFYAL